MKFRAESFNYMMEGAELAHRQTRFAVDLEGPDRAMEVVRVWNKTKKDLDKYAVVGLGKTVLMPDHQDPLLLDPIDPFSLFLSDRVYVEAVVPTLDHRSSFGILLEPLNMPNGDQSPDLAVAVVAGCVQVQVRKSGTGDRWALGASGREPVPRRSTIAWTGKNRLVRGWDRCQVGDRPTRPGCESEPDSAAERLPVGSLKTKPLAA